LLVLSGQSKTPVILSAAKNPHLLLLLLVLSGQSKIPVILSAAKNPPHLLLLLLVLAFVFAVAPFEVPSNLPVLK
jgi:hypothetical protein